MPLHLVSPGKFHKVPVIMGAQHDGGSLFEKVMGTVIPNFDAASPNQTNIDTALNWTLGPDETVMVKERYQFSECSPLGDKADAKWVMRTVRDLGFHCSNRILVESWHSAGLDPFVHTMSFDYGLIDKWMNIGVFHAIGLTFVLRSALLDLAEWQLWCSNAHRMADIVQRTWATFAKTGNLNGALGMVFPRNCGKIIGSLVAWPAHKETRHYFSLQV